MNILNSIFEKANKKEKMLSVLIDPDKFSLDKKSEKFLSSCEKIKADYLFVGGSLLTGGEMDILIRFIKEKTSIPLILFPGDVMQVHAMADAILFLSLISGRNAELLIGKHVAAAPYVRKSGLESISCGYMLIDGGNITTASYISQTIPIPCDKSEIAVATAMAGEMLGMKLIYADAGSGAKHPVPGELIAAVRKNISVPVIVGGGIKNISDAEKAWQNGADMVVIGTAFEQNPELIERFSKRK